MRAPLIICVHFDPMLNASRYPYVSHMVFNAGLASFSGIDWPAAIKQIAMTPITAVTTPNFHLQHAGEMSVDGLGWVWQCNLFGHYALVSVVQAFDSLHFKPHFVVPCSRGVTSTCTSQHRCTRYMDYLPGRTPGLLRARRLAAHQDTPLVWRV